MDIVVAPVKIEKILDRRSKTEQKIREAIKNLQEKEIKVTYTNIMKETGIRSRATIFRNGHLLKQL
jgi:CRISPR/Cas system-associated protein Cas10 (large subunit of type III CRISPR-Cas system)